ncbi:MAG: hypothetical protein ACRDRH_28805, partial [Pseudonocardia sp.]
METPIEDTDPFVALATEVGQLGRRLDRIGSELFALHRTRSQDPPPAAPSGGTPAGGWANPRQYPPGGPPPRY